MIYQHIDHPFDREKYLRDARDLARDVAAALEAQNAAAAALHLNKRYCQAHGMPDEECGSGWIYRCWECAKHTVGRPCRTSQALRGEWTP